MHLRHPAPTGLSERSPTQTSSSLNAPATWMRRFAISTECIAIKWSTLRSEVIATVVCKAPAFTAIVRAGGAVFTPNWHERWSALRQLAARSGATTPLRTSTISSEIGGRRTPIPLLIPQSRPLRLRTHKATTPFLWTMALAHGWLGVHYELHPTRWHPSDCDRGG